ncbi:hypothetical protein B0H11DRAFT_2347618 [Mycena galericulata]|nr:hypothetical protein B0H11DRAFT_2347618 [Mycena galericulata]
MEAPRVAPLVTSPIVVSPSKLSRDCRSRITAVSDLDAKEKAAVAARLRETRVKKPALTSLASLTVDGDFRAYARSKALRWALNTDVFLLPIDINDLKNRPKNTEELKSQAAERITAMENEPEDATSAVFKDKNGVMLACVFARRSLNVMKIHGAYPGTVGRTLGHFSESARNEDNYDGLNESLIRRTWEATQTLHSVVQPITPQTDVRHNDENCMFEVAYPEYHAKYTIDGPSDSNGHPPMGRPWSTTDERLIPESLETGNQVNRYVKAYPGLYNPSSAEHPASHQEAEAHQYGGHCWGIDDVYVIESRVSAFKFRGAEADSLGGSSEYEMETIGFQRFMTWDWASSRRVLNLQASKYFDNQAASDCDKYGTGIDPDCPVMDIGIMGLISSKHPESRDLVALRVPRACLGLNSGIFQAQPAVQSIRPDLLQAGLAMERQQQMGICTGAQQSTILAIGLTTLLHCQSETIAVPVSDSSGPAATQSAALKLERKPQQDLTEGSGTIFQQILCSRIHQTSKAIFLGCTNLKHQATTIWGRTHSKNDKAAESGPFQNCPKSKFPRQEVGVPKTRDINLRSLDGGCTPPPPPRRDRLIGPTGCGPMSAPTLGRLRWQEEDVEGGFVLGMSKNPAGNEMLLKAIGVWE